MKVLELFAGSCSFSNQAKKLGMETFTTDYKDFEGIDYVTDILNFDINKIPFKPDIIWASPPCTYFSVASIGKHWHENHTPKSKEAVLGLEILNKTLEIIKKYPTSLYFIENPVGKMRRIIKGINRTTITYCSYGEKRMKPTDIWSNNIYDIFNLNGWKPRDKCFNGNKKCDHEEAPRGSKTGTQGLKDNYERSIVPKELCLEILKSCIK
jgi:hypothetical protein